MDLDHGTTLEEYIARVHAQRAELRESAAALDEALERPLGTARWRERVHTALVELAHDFRDHVDLSESGGGLFQTVLEEDPRLTPGIERQREEHVDLHERIETAIATIDAAGKAAGILTFNETLNRRYIELGARFVAVGSDVAEFAGALRGLAARYGRGNAATGGPSGY